MIEIDNQQSHIIKVEKPKSKIRILFVETVKFLAIFLFFFSLSTIFVMWPTIYTNINYYFTESSIVKSDNNLGLPASSIDYSSIVPIIKERKITIPEGTRLVIPKINVDAPIIFMDTSNNQDILETIKNGVAHYAGTAMPGRIGNMFITGHSSYYWWNGGKYNQVFALLNHLSVNDLVYVYHNGGMYIYRVKDSIIVNPNQTDVLNPTTIPTLSIMTCTPIGTNLKRLIVRADLISTPPVDRSQLRQFTDIPKIPVILPLD